MSEGQSTVEYREIKGFPGYRVGSDGTVWSRRLKQPMKGRPNRTGHLRVVLNPGYSRRWIHRLVLEAFTGPCPCGMEARHFPDRNPANNTLANLSWSTKSINCGDRQVHGTQVQGERQWKAVLTETMVRILRKEYAAEGNIRMLARRWKLDRHTVGRAVKRRTWKHIV